VEHRALPFLVILWLRLRLRNKADSDSFSLFLFSEWGAIQLLRDFTAVREWVSADSRLSSEARRSVLQLEILKRCEGVAYLLLRTPGDTLGVGKSAGRNHRSESGATGN